MKLRVISDLHLDINSKYEFNLDNQDIFTVICGDISAYFDITSQWINKNIKQGLFIAGNHICYNEAQHSLQYFLQQYETLYPLDKNISFLNNSHKIVNDIVFVGATLWTDYKLLDKNNPDLYMWYSTHKLNDFRYCKTNDCYNKNDKKENLRPLKPEDCVKMFNESLNYIASICNIYKDKKIVVITHHAPSLLSIPDNYKNDETAPCFASSLENFILDHPNIKLWTHGHIHTFSDYQIGNCRVVCNPRGYIKYNENSQFNKNFIVEI